MAGISSNCSPCKRNPAFFNFAGGDGQATVGEKRASVRGQISRGTLGAGKRDRCKSGTPCGLTCIAANEDCIIDFSEPVRAALTQMAQYIMKERAKGGKPVQEDSEEDIQLGKAVGLVGSQLTREATYKRGSGKNKKDVTERTFDRTIRGQSRAISPSEIRDLKANVDKLGNAEFDQTAMKALQKEVFSRGVTLNRESLEHLFDSLPLAARTALMQSGDPGKGAWYGKDKNGNEVTNLNNGTRERGLAVLDMYVRQGGRSAYGNSQRVISPADLDVEHVRPASKGGLDHPSNWILARSGAQRQRANEELGKWIKSLPDPDDPEALRKYYSNFAAAQQKKNATKAAVAAVDPRGLADSELVKVSPKNLRYMFDRDSFFATGFYSSGGGTARMTGAPPVPVSKAYALVRKHNEDAAKDVRSQTKQIFNKGWYERGGSTADMTNQMINLYRQNLPQDAFKAIEPQLLKWQADTLKAYPSGPPRVIGGSNPPEKMSDAEAASAIDDLLKSL